MPTATTEPEVWGRWRVVSEDAKFVTAQCSCGVLRKFIAGTWKRKLHVSALCRACLIKRENNRMSTYIFGKKPLPERVST